MITPETYEQVPRFQPHLLIRGGHAQTLAGRYLGGLAHPFSSRRHQVRLPDGDRLVVDVATPPGWSPEAPSALIVHGLAGCSRAPYVLRLTHRLHLLGVQTLRMNLRNAGPGFGRARGVYHAGRTEDLRAVLAWAAVHAPASPIALVGFSLGANLVLKLAGELDTHTCPSITAVLAASPPVDLSACCRFLMRPTGRPYDRNLVAQLVKLVDRLHDRFPELGAPDLAGVRSLYQFDDRYTAPRNGFTSAEDYYARSSSARFIPKIPIPGLVVHARDDPFIPPDPVTSCAWPPQLDVEILDHGGHLGFVSHKPWAGDRRWLEARMSAWLRRHWETLRSPHALHTG